MTTSMERTSKTNDCDEGEREEMLEEGLEKNVTLYHYVSGIVGMTYNPFINEDIRDCYFDYDQAELLISWLPKISTKRSIASQQVKLGLVLEERVTASSMPKTTTMCRELLEGPIILSSMRLYVNVTSITIKLYC